MSKSALLDLMPDTRRKIIYHEEDGKTYVETKQEVSHIIAAAKIMADEKPGKDFRHVAYVPDEVINQSMLDGWFHDPVAWKKWLNDPQNEALRTWKGRV